MLTVKLCTPNDDNVMDDLAESLENGDVPEDSLIGELFEQIDQGNVSVLCSECDESIQSDEMYRYDPRYCCERCTRRLV